MDSKVIVGDFIQKCLTHLQFNYKKVTVFLILKYILIFSYMHIVTVGMWGHVFHYINTLDGEAFRYAVIGSDVAGIISSYVAMYIEIIYLIYNKQFRLVLEELGNFEVHDVPENFPEEMKKLNQITKISMITFYLSQYLVWFLTLLQTCEDGDESDCGLPITGYMPFDIFYSPMRQIFSFLQCTSAFHSGTIALAIALMLLFMFQTLVLYLKHLQVLLMQIPGMDNRRERRKMVKTCVLYHYRILYLTEMCGRHSQKLLFVLVSLASVVISVTSYQLIAVKVEYITIVHLCAYLFSCLAICIEGENLITESENLFFTLYEAVPWGGDVATAKDLYIMMMMAKKELYLPAGKFGPIGHVRAMLLLKTSYSFLTLILNV